MPRPSCVLPIRAQPNARNSAIVGWLGDSLKVKLQAPPVDGKANTELCRFLAEVLGLPRSAVTLAGGSSSRQKRITITGLSLDQVRMRLPE